MWRSNDCNYKCFVGDKAMSAIYQGRDVKYELCIVRIVYGTKCVSYKFSTVRVVHNSRRL